MGGRHFHIADGRKRESPWVGRCGHCRRWFGLSGPCCSPPGHEVPSPFIRITPGPTSPLNCRCVCSVPYCVSPLSCLKGICVRLQGLQLGPQAGRRGQDIRCHRAGREGSTSGLSPWPVDSGLFPVSLYFIFFLHMSISVSKFPLLLGTSVTWD